MNKTFILIGLFLSFCFYQIYAQCDLRGESYDGLTFEDYEEIVMLDPMIRNSGMSKSDSSLIHINLVDMARRYGYISEDVLSAYIMTKGALDELWPGDSIPVRNDIRITTDVSYGVCEIIAEIINANKDSREAPYTWIVEDSLNKMSYINTVIFEKISTGKKIEMRWNYNRFLKLNSLRPSYFSTLKRKVLFGDATDEEVSEFSILNNRMIKRVLNGEIAPYEGRILE